MKSFTDIEQSKKLAEILPLGSADMSYSFNFNAEAYELTTVPYKDWIVPKYAQPDEGFGQVIPCWSFSALLSVIPKRIDDFNVLRMDIDDNDFAIWYDEMGGIANFGVNDKLPDITMTSPIDACVEMILKLHQLKML